jgi:hypothetical protein
MIIVFVGYYLVSTAPATLHLGKGGVAAGGYFFFSDAARSVPTAQTD